MEIQAEHKNRFKKHLPPYRVYFFWCKWGGDKDLEVGEVGEVWEVCEVCDVQKVQYVQWVQKVGDFRLPMLVFGADL